MRLRFRREHFVAVDGSAKSTNKNGIANIPPNTSAQDAGFSLVFKDTLGRLLFTHECAAVDALRV